MLTVTQAAATKSFRDARARGAGVTDAVASARWSDAFYNRVRQTVADANKRSKAAKKAWKTRRRNAA